MNCLRFKLSLILTLISTICRPLLSCLRFKLSLILTNIYDLLFLSALSCSSAGCLPNKSAKNFLLAQQFFKVSSASFFLALVHRAKTLALVPAVPTGAAVGAVVLSSSSSSFGKEKKKNVSH
jgi:hypothetical protein